MQLAIFLIYEMAMAQHGKKCRPAYTTHHYNVTSTPRFLSTALNVVGRHTDTDTSAINTFTRKRKERILSNIDVKATVWHNACTKGNTVIEVAPS